MGQDFVMWVEQYTEKASPAGPVQHHVRGWLDPFGELTQDVTKAIHASFEDMRQHMAGLEYGEIKVLRCELRRWAEIHV